MGLFFDTGKYLTRVESPRIDATKDRREQINDYIVSIYHQMNFIAPHQSKYRLSVW